MGGTLRGIAFFPRLLLLCCVVLLGAHPADAHRPGESYVYLVVDDGPLRGEVHVRFEDLAQVIELDSDGDGLLGDDEVRARRDAIAAYVADRISFHTGTGAHRPVMGDLDVFGHAAARQMQLFFSVPTLDPPPDRLGVEFRFLYDTVDPAHVPMLLFKSNTRMRLDENEWVVSAAFRPGADRQEVSLMPAPWPETAARMILSGIRQIVTSPYHALLALLALLPCAWRVATPDDAALRPAGGAARAAAATSVALGFGVAGGLLLREVWIYRLDDRGATNLLLLALLAVAAHNVLARPWLPRALLVGLAGLLVGATRSLYGTEVGISKGLLEVVVPGFALGVALGTALLALVLIPLLFAFAAGRSGRGPVRIGSAGGVAAAALTLAAGVTL